MTVIALIYWLAGWWVDHLERGPRERVVSDTHLALMPSSDLLAVVENSATLELAIVQTGWGPERSTGRHLLAEHRVAN
jgi:hypothetical protein